MTSPKSKEQVVPEGKTPLSDFPADILNVAAQAVDEMPQRAPFKADVLEAIARAILAERERDQWRPIETAPTNGDWFIASQNGDVYPCEWRVDTPDEGMSREGWFDHFNQSFEAPTHWQPIPTPPKGEGA